MLPLDSERFRSELRNILVHIQKTRKEKKKKEARRRGLQVKKIWLADKKVELLNLVFYKVLKMFFVFNVFFLAQLDGLLCITESSWTENWAA